jgi:VanZ family protein
MFSYAWFPFSFSVNPGQLKYHLKLLALSSTDFHNLLNAIPYMVLYFYLQVLAIEIVEKYSNFNKILLKINVSLFIVLVVSFLQFLGQSFVSGRTYNFSDLIMMIGGITSGIVISYNLYIKGQLVFDKNNSYLVIILKVTLFLNFIFIIGASLFPFNWNIEYHYIFSKLMIALVPFNSYADSSKLYLLIDLSKDISKFLPVTFIISAIYDLEKKQFPIRVSIYLFFAITVLELLQIFHKDFNPDISDILLGVFSLYLGRKIWILGKISLKSSG